LEKLSSDDFTLLIFPGQKNNLGFVAKVTETQNLLSSLVSWETTMENDTDKLFAILGKEGPALSSSFKTSFYQGVGFRYLTISREDFGICYAWFDDYFVLTSSFDSMKKTIDAVKAKELESQVGQLFIIGFEGKSVTPDFEQLFRKYLPGGVLLLSKNIESKEQLKKLTEDLQSLSLREAKLPLFIAVDQEGGVISRVDFAGEKTPQSEINDPNQAYQVGLERGEELKDLGINLNLAPVLDMTQEGDFLFNRSFQKDAAETGELAKSLVLGQKTAGILSAVKHFPGYGDINFNPEGSLAKVDSLPEISQFKKAAEASPEFVLTANVVYKSLDSSLPFSFSSNALQFLKANLGENALIVTDDLAQNYLLENFSLEDIIKKPIEAGADILIFSGWEIDVSQGLDAFFTSFENNEISQAKIKEAISKIIKIKENI
ncbi:MAG: glycoside hydrolase family 3 N-terminal domain-containing protein, partial [Candidatus Pacebacteria bacterium]|nr:glycoside hydrolase family 3 N-terminal domain-containing protein [Candidatus Paceibacterota bacterium]